MQTLKHCLRTLRRHLGRVGLAYITPSRKSSISNLMSAAYRPDTSSALDVQPTKVGWLILCG